MIPFAGVHDNTLKVWAIPKINSLQANSKSTLADLGNFESTKLYSNTFLPWSLAI